MFDMNSLLHYSVFLDCVTETQAAFTNNETGHNGLKKKPLW